MSATKKTAKKTVKKVTKKAAPKAKAGGSIGVFAPDPVMFNSLAGMLTRALKKEAVTVEMGRVENADAYYVHAFGLNALFSFTVTGRDIDAAGPAIVALLKARILKALA